MKQFHSDPEIWIDLYRLEEIGRISFFNGLIHCTKFHSAQKIVELLSKDEEDQFEEFVQRYSDLRDDEELLSIGDPAPWDVKDIKEFLRYFGSE